MVGLTVTTPRRPTVAQAIRRCPRGGIVPARDEEGQEVAVVRLTSGQVCVVADRCPHDGGRVSDGFVEEDRLVCARHQWELDPRHRDEDGCPLRAALVETTTS